jgi:hypothetical protein
MFAAEGAVGVTWIAHGKGMGWVVNDTCGSTHAPRCYGLYSAIGVR